MVALTIGMATYQDFDGVYFTIQALRLYQDLADTELLVVDNYGCEHTKSFVESWAFGRYVLATGAVGTSAPRDLVFREARGEAVLCCDSHILFAPGAIARLKDYYHRHPDTIDLLQGPHLYDDLHNYATHFEPVWREQMWGTWAVDPRGEDPEGEPFEIPMQGLGVFSCRKAAWPGFNPRFRGFGGEEGYIHEKVRQAGGRCLCLPWLRWLHRFGRPAGVPYPLTSEDRIRNYVIGHVELGLDPEPILEHFHQFIPEERLATIAVEALWGPMGGGAEPPAAREAGTAGQNEPPAAEPGQGAARPKHALTGLRDLSVRRAIACFVEDEPHLVQQLLALRHSWIHVQSPDTDLVVMGPPEVLAHLPADLVKITQRPVADDPMWQGYRYVNAIACLNGSGAEQLDRYTHLLRTDVDTFLTPAWNRFYPEGFCWGPGGYANDDHVRDRIRAIAAEYGFAHHGHINIGAAWYGPTEVVRRAGALAEILTKHILTHHFATGPGAWPGWYRGVAWRYAGEIAVNHCAPDGQATPLLDFSSASGEPIEHLPHIHCWHTDEKFSKHWFTAGRYTREDTQALELGIVRDYCMEMSFRSLDDLEAFRRLEAESRPEVESPPGHRAEERDPVARSVVVPGNSDSASSSASAPLLIDPATLPLVSCLCATYNRPPDHQHLLEEAIASFLRQTYPNKELIVLNDCPGQELICDAPGVRVVNVRERFSSLGAKGNAAVALARGDLLAPWDDDDISLPWRLSLSVERLGEADYFNPRAYWYLDDVGLHCDHAVGYAHNASLFRRTAFERVGGYSPINVGSDAVIDAALARLTKGADPHIGAEALTRSEWFYIYRWGVSPVHVSAGGTEQRYEAIGRLPVEEGRFDLTPHWRQDYVAETRRLLEVES